MMVEGYKMNFLYYDLYQNKGLEDYLTAYGEFLKSQGQEPITWGRCDSVEDVLRQSDVVSLHPLLDETTHHLMNEERLNLMKPNAILINASRGPVIDEVALVNHLNKNPDFRTGLDVFEDEPAMKPGLEKCPNAVIVPHIASATIWTRSGMASLAAGNVAGVLNGYGCWQDQDDILAFLEGGDAPKAAPSIVNRDELSLPAFSG